MDILNFLNNYWAIILFVGTVIGHAFVARSRSQMVEMRLKHLERNSDDRNKQDAETRAKLMVLETMLQNLNQVMTDLKNDIRRFTDRQSV